jgi:hypothetical protein
MQITLAYFIHGDVSVGLYLLLTITKLVYILKMFFFSSSECKDNIRVTNKLLSGYHHGRGSIKPASKYLTLRNLHSYSFLKLEDIKWRKLVYHSYVKYNDKSYHKWVINISLFDFPKSNLFYFYICILDLKNITLS